MTDDRFQEKEDQALAGLFAEAKANPSQISADFMQSLLMQAVNVQANLAPASRAPQKRAWSILQSWQNWSAGMGLVTATVLGVMVGINPPESVYDVTTAYFATDSLSDMTDFDMLFAAEWEG